MYNIYYIVMNEVVSVKSVKGADWDQNNIRLVIRWKSIENCSVGEYAMQSLSIFLKSIEVAGFFT